MKKKHFLNEGFEKIIKPRFLTGDLVDLYFWHPFTLHGTQPALNGIPKISLGILIEKSIRSNLNCEIDKINNEFIGKKILINTGNDIDNNRKIIKSNNILNKINI